MGEEVERIKERLDIAEVVGEYVQLKSAGRSLKGLCPFHQEKTPSFMVSPDRGTWYCFGCSEGGDHFSFIQRVEGVDFPGALKMLAEKAGVELKGGVDRQTASRRQRLFDLLTETAQLYSHILGTQAAAEKARTYLRERGLQPETWDLLRIGYAPQSWDLLQKYLQKKGYRLDEMVEAGVVGRSQRGRHFDRFRGRIMFPIADTQGRVLAFGGRIAPWHETGNEGKYVNSPETSLYEKRRVVYNLQRAREVLRGGEPCLVVEGYMDVALLEQVGVRNVVASSGTAFTDEQISQIRRFTDALHVAFDADAAGWKATVAATEAALRAGMKVETVTLPEGNDPADLVLERQEAVVEVMRDTRPLMAVLLEQLAAGATNEQQLEAAAGLLTLVTNPIQQGQMVQEVAERLHVPASTVLQVMANRGSGMSRAVPAAEDTLSGGEDGGQERGTRQWVEQLLLGILMRHSRLRADMWERLDADFWLDSNTALLYNSLQELTQTEARFFDMSARELVDHLAEAKQSYAEGLLARAEEFLATAAGDEEGLAEGLERWLKRERLKGKLRVVQGELGSGAEEERSAALRKFQALAEELSLLDQV